MPDELDLIKSLGRDQAEPDEEGIARARHLLEQRIAAPRARSPVRLRWGLVVVAAALLLGSGLGFGVGSFVTPSGSAGPFRGFGFTTAQGWSVVQTGAHNGGGVARAIAANVPLESADVSSDLPHATLRRLPPDGAVIVARLAPRGDESNDAKYPLGGLPLRVADAVPATLPPALSETRLVALRLRAGTGGYNVDARVFFGGPPSPASLAGVDAQLERLVVSQSGVTLVVAPRVISDWSQRMTIFGSVASGKADQKVAVQFKACGLFPSQFRDAFETTTRAGGGFSFSEIGPFNLRVSGAYRAVSGDAVSAEVPVQQRPFVSLRAVRRGRFVASAGGTVPFWRRQVVLQRFERRRGVWITVRRLVLTEQLGGAPGAAPPFQTVSTVGVETEPFRPAVPRGTMIRVVFPLAQARPCYLAGVSKTLRVG